MADYAQAVLALKSRWNAKQDLSRFYDDVRQALVVEVEKANSALAYEQLPLIQIFASPSLQLNCIETHANIELDKKTPAIGAKIVNESGEKSVTFTLDVSQSPLKARRVSLAPATEPLIGPEEVAAIIVQELIEVAP
jgi:hypothetical protein